MTDFLILDSAQADAVRGPTGPGCALEPRETATPGVWALPLAVLSDPRHAERWATLAALPQGPVSFPPPEPDGL